MTGGFITAICAANSAYQTGSDGKRVIVSVEGNWLEGQNQTAIQI